MNNTINDDKQPFRQYARTDSVRVECPCGASFEGEGLPVVEFQKEHALHTNGFYIDHEPGYPPVTRPIYIPAKKTIPLEPKPNLFAGMVHQCGPTEFQVEVDSACVNVEVGANSTVSSISVAHAQDLAKQYGTARASNL